MWDTLINFGNMGIQSVLIFGDNCRIFFKDMGYFLKKINGIWDTGTPSSRASLISAFVFATRIVQSLYFLNLKFQASRHILWMYSPVCVGPGRKPRIPVFSQRGSYTTRGTM